MGFPCGAGHTGAELCVTLARGLSLALLGDSSPAAARASDSYGRIRGLGYRWRGFFGGLRLEELLGATQAGCRCVESL